MNLSVYPLGLITLLAGSLSFADFKPSSQATVDQFISYALSTPKSVLLARSGPVVCEQLVVLQASKPFAGKGNNVDEALTVAQLLCMQHQCAITGDLVRDKVQEMTGQGSSVTVENLRNLNFSEEEIQNILKYLKTSKGNSNQVSCETSALARIRAYDMCVAVPYSCGDVSSGSDNRKSNNNHQSQDDIVDRR